MTTEEQIAELLAQAEPLRALDPDEAEAAGLPGIVDKINVLRAEQAGEVAKAHLAALMAPALPPATPVVEKRKPGPKPKAPESA